MSVLPRQVALLSETLAVNVGDLATAAAALQKQATRDFGPIWGVNATVDAFERLEDIPLDYWPIVILDDIDEPGAAGYHTDQNGQPFALVQADNNWALTVSHECLEMLADPFGNRTVAGAPPPQAPSHIQRLRRVVYLVEVCDPCEGKQFAYTSNGVTVSDFITPHYYDPQSAAAVRYSFRGGVTGPHVVLDDGYVSFGNPVDNHWFQIVVRNGQPQLVDLGVLNARGRSLREMIDAKVRASRPGYRVRARTARAMAAGGTGSEDPQVARAGQLRREIESLEHQ